MQFQGDKHALSGVALRIVSAGGSVANVAAAFEAVALLRRSRGALHTPLPRPWWLFLWLFATVKFQQAGGYPLYSGLGNIGDWAAVVAGFEPPWLWRVLLIAFGASAYWAAARWAMDCLGRRMRGSPADRAAEANRYTLIAYAAGGVLSVAAGLFEPGGAALVLISGAAASLGGNSALAWGPQLLHDPRLGAPPDTPLQVRRHVR